MHIKSCDRMCIYYNNVPNVDWSQVEVRCCNTEQNKE